MCPVEFYKKNFLFFAHPYGTLKKTSSLYFCDLLLHEGEPQSDNKFTKSKEKQYVSLNFSFVFKNVSVVNFMTTL